MDDDYRKWTAKQEIKYQQNPEKRGTIRDGIKNVMWLLIGMAGSMLFIILFSASQGY